MSARVVSRDEPRWSGIAAFCSGCGGRIEQGEQRLVVVDGHTLTMRHDVCERRGTLPIFRSTESLLGRLTA